MSKSNNRIKPESKNNSGTGSKCRDRNTKKGFDQSPTRKPATTPDKPTGDKGYPNDHTWYFISKEMEEQVSQMSMQNMLGFSTVDGYAVPTIMRILLNPSVGNTCNLQLPEGTTTPSSDYVHGKAAVNAMADQMYTLMSSFTGRTAAYQPSDIAIMILALSSFAEGAEYIRRAFGCLLTYNQRNRALPKVLIQSMGIDYADMAANIANYRMRFNSIITRINQIPMLDNVTYLTKSREIYQRIFLDSPSSMAQIFYYAPSRLWTINEAAEDTGTVLEDSVWVGAAINRKLSVYLDYLETMCTRLVESSTMNLIYSDLLNMANKIKVSFWHFDYLAENYVVMPEYNIGAVLQWHNLDLIGTPQSIMGTTVGHTKTVDGIKYTTANCVVSDPDTHEIVYNPVFLNRTSTPKDTIVDFFTDSPDVIDRVEALRISVALGPIKTTIGSTLYISFVALPDHYATEIRIFKNSTTGSDAFSVEDETSGYNRCEWTQFENGPIFRNSAYVWGSLNYFTTVDYEFMRRVNEFMMLGLFSFRVGQIAPTKKE